MSPKLKTSWLLMATWVLVCAVGGGCSPNADQRDRHAVDTERRCTVSVGSTYAEVLATIRKVRPGAKEVGALSQKFTRLYIVDVGSANHLVVYAEEYGQKVTGYGFYRVVQSGVFIPYEGMVQLAGVQRSENGLFVYMGGSEAPVNRQLGPAGFRIDGGLAHFRDLDLTSLVEWWTGPIVSVCTACPPATGGQQERCFLLAEEARAARIEGKGFSLYYPRFAGWLRVIEDKWYWEKRTDAWE
jgi:hypothetical protein